MLLKNRNIHKNIATACSSKFFKLNGVFAFTNIWTKLFISMLIEIDSWSVFSYQFFEIKNIMCVNLFSTSQFFEKHFSQ